MAEIHPEKVFESLRSEIRRALADTLHEHFPGLRFDEDEVSRAFVGALTRKCRQWESIPNDALKLTKSELSREASRRLDRP